MDPTSVATPSAADFAQALVGLVVLLLPGAAAADRILPGHPWRWALAPLLSLTILPLLAIVADYAAGVHVTAANTTLFALGAAVLLARGRLTAWLTPGPEDA